MYNQLLALIVAITRESQRRHEVLQGKALREGTAAPSAKFVNNRFALQLESNEQLREFLETQKRQWSDYPEFIGLLFEQIEQSHIYQDYINDKEDSYAADRELWRKLYRTFIQENEDLDSLLEEQSLYWNDDKEVVDTFVLKTIKRFEEKNGDKQELLPEYDSEEARDYARRLFRATILNTNDYQRMMTEASHNWDFSRLAYMDVIIMQIAIAEMMTFPSIPISVTINEFVELSKFYSTPRSAGYINGMLDTIARHLVATGQLLKPIEEKKQQ